MPCLMKPPNTFGMLSSFRSVMISLLASAYCIANCAPIKTIHAFILARVAYSIPASCNQTLASNSIWQNSRSLISISGKASFVFSRLSHALRIFCFLLWKKFIVRSFLIRWLSVFRISPLDLASLNVVDSIRANTSVSRSATRTADERRKYNCYADYDGGNEYHPVSRNANINYFPHQQINIVVHLPIQFV